MQFGHSMSIDVVKMLRIYCKLDFNKEFKICNKSALLQILLWKHCGSLAESASAYFKCIDFFISTYISSADISAEMLWIFSCRKSAAFSSHMDVCLKLQHTPAASSRTSVNWCDFFFFLSVPITKLKSLNGSRILCWSMFLFSRMSVQSSEFPDSLQSDISWPNIRLWMATTW